jgi:hypothetical protein
MFSSLDDVRWILARRETSNVKLIASGRASEIFDLGDGRVLRRFRAGGDREREALVMEHARTNVTDRERERARRMLERAR